MCWAVAVAPSVTVLSVCVNTAQTIGKFMKLKHTIKCIQIHTELVRFRQKLCEDYG